MSEHRVPMLGASWRRLEDPATSRDPKVRELVSALSALPSPAPSADFKADLRAQLVAITPRLVAEGFEADGPMVDIVSTEAAAGRPSPIRRAAAPKHTDSVLAKVRQLHLGRPLAVAASVVAAFAMLLGGAVWMGKKALPGDALYGVKRASESFELATAGSDGEKASDLLRFAGYRAQEVHDLLGRAHVSAAGVSASGVDGSTAGLVSSTLGSADGDVRSAWNLLVTRAVAHGSTAPLGTMTAWAPGQIDRLHEIVLALPAGSLHDRALASENLVRGAFGRAEALRPAIGRACLATSGSDAFGPLPCTDAALPTVPRHTTAPAKPHSATPARPVRTTPAAPAASTAKPRPASSAGGSSTTTSGGSGSATGGGLLPLPTVTKLPVTVNTCGVSASLGPIGIGLGLCPSKTP